MLYCDEKSDANIVPVDICVNGLIASAWDIAERFQNTKTEKDDVELPIYNYESVNEKVHNSLPHHILMIIEFVHNCLTIILLHFS